MDMEYVKATLERELAVLMEKIGICYADNRGYEHWTLPQPVYKVKQRYLNNIH